MTIVWYLITAINRKSKCHPVWTISRHCSQHPVPAKSLTSPTFLLWHSIDKTRLASHISHRRKLWNTSQTLQASLYYIYLDYMLFTGVWYCSILFGMWWKLHLDRFKWWYSEKQLEKNVQTWLLILLPKLLAQNIGLLPLSSYAGYVYLLCWHFIGVNSRNLKPMPRAPNSHYVYKTHDPW